MAVAEFVSDAVERLSRRDPTLQRIYLFGHQHTDAQLAELVDCLLAHPNVVSCLWLADNRLTDETGLKLARYLAASSIIQTLDLSQNWFGEATYLALAAALRVNTSLWHLNVCSHALVDRTRIDAAFIDALRLNPDRSTYSEWELYSCGFTDIDFKRLKHAAEQLGHPSLQLLLALL